MKEHPILFSGEMVRAILAGRKSMTRRLVRQATGPSLSVDMTSPGTAELSWLCGPGPGYDVDEQRKSVTCPYGAPGDRLWVKETWAVLDMRTLKYVEGSLHGKILGYGGQPPTLMNLRIGDGDAMVGYAAHPTSPEELMSSPGFTTWRSSTPRSWRSPLFMPRWASRLTLRVTAVRVERLNDISEEDARAEGCAVVDPSHHTCARDVFAALWDTINGKRAPWSSNPWVWVVSFEVVP